jgi:hypothetical protein
VDLTHSQACPETIGSRSVFTAFWALGLWCVAGRMIRAQTWLDAKIAVSLLHGLSKLLEVSVS